METRTDRYGALARGQTFSYFPEDLTIVGSPRFADWCREQFGEHGPRVLCDPDHPAQALYDPRVEKVHEPDWLEGLLALAADVKEHGVEQPIGFHLGETIGGRPQVLIVYGRRRVLAAAFANRALREEGVTDPDELVKLEGKAKRGKWAELRLAMIAENDNRVNNPPSVQAENAHRAIVVRGQDLRRVANRMGKPVVYVERLLELRECEELVIRGVDDGSIPIAAVSDLRKLPPAKQRKQAERLRSVPAKTGRSAKAQVRAENPEHAPAPPPPPCKRRQAILAERAALEDRLSDPKYDAFRRQTNAALQALRWVLGEVDPPSTWKAGPVAR